MYTRKKYKKNELMKKKTKKHKNEILAIHTYFTLSFSLSFSIATHVFYTFFSSPFAASISAQEMK